MPFKTILAHIAHDDRYRDRSVVALDLAERFSAHVSLIYTALPVHIPAGSAGRGASFAYLAEATAAAHEHAEAISKEMTADCERRGLGWDWVIEDGEHSEALASHAHLADLLVVTQFPARFFEDRLRRRLPEHMALIAGCPVLVLPYEVHPPSVGQNILVAWKNSREATRTVRDALPFLRTADKVTVLTVDPPKHEYLPGVDIGTFLSRHGVDADIESDIADDSEAGEVIVAKAKDLGSDMIVMGASGHSRLHELILGGATQHVLRHTSLPVLMAN